MENKGQTAPVGLAIIVSIFMFIVAMAVISPMQDRITDVRTAGGLNCGSAATISDGTKLTCLAIDWIIPGFIIAILQLIGGLITFKATSK